MVCCLYSRNPGENVANGVSGMLFHTEMIGPRYCYHLTHYPGQTTSGAEFALPALVVFGRLERNHERGHFLIFLHSV